jgi:hypothetical protein
MREKTPQFFAFSTPFEMAYPIGYDKRMADMERQHKPPLDLVQAGLTAYHGLTTSEREALFAQCTELGVMDEEAQKRVIELARSRFWLPWGWGKQADIAYWFGHAEPVPHYVSAEPDQSGVSRYTYVRALALAMTGVDDPDLIHDSDNDQIELIGDTTTHGLQALREYRLLCSEHTRRLASQIKAFAAAGGTLAEYWSICGAAVHSYGPLLRVLAYLAVCFEGEDRRVKATLAEYLALYHGREFELAEGNTGANTAWAALYRAVMALLHVRRHVHNGERMLLCPQPLSADERNIIDGARQTAIEYLKLLGPGCQAAAQWLGRPVPIHTPTPSAQKKLRAYDREVLVNRTAKARKQQGLAALAYTHQVITGRVPQGQGYALNDASLSRWLGNLSLSNPKLPPGALRRTMGDALRPYGFSRDSSLGVTQWITGVMINDDSHAPLYYLPQSESTYLVNSRSSESREYHRRAVEAWLLTPAGQACADAAQQLGLPT